MRNRYRHKRLRRYKASQSFNKNKVPGLLKSKWFWIGAAVVIVVVFFKQQLLNLLDPVMSVFKGSTNAVDGLSNFLGISDNKKQEYADAERKANELTSTAFNHEWCMQFDGALYEANTDFDGVAAAKEIHGAIYLLGFIPRPWANDWPTIMANFKRACSRIGVSYICKCYYSTYGEDLLSVLQHGFIGIKDEENYSSLMSFVYSLP
jgi:hypothetical protein